MTKEEALKFVSQALSEYIQTLQPSIKMAYVPLANAAISELAKPEFQTNPATPPPQTTVE